MELTLVGMQNSGKTTFVNVLAVSFILSCKIFIQFFITTLTLHQTYIIKHSSSFLCIFSNVGNIYHS